MRGITSSAHPERSRGARSSRAGNKASTALGGVSRLRSTRAGLVAAVLLACAAPALADSLMPASEYAYKQLPDARQEAQAKALMETLRCLVCQGQSIADSDAEMAGDMRALVRQRIEAGEKPEQIRQWLIERYGNWVSYKPPVEPVTWPLWAAPILLVAAGLFLARGRFRKKAR
jgi:cytochrome c-type biogenesis protein CcmH